MSNTPRLTAYTREQIVKTAIKATFDAKFEALRDAEHALAIEAYEAVFSADVRKQAAEMQTGWLHLDECLRFNVAGLNIRLNLQSPGVPVPYDCGYCSRLGTVTGDLADRIRRHVDTTEDLKSEKRVAFDALEALLKTCSTAKRLEAVWPEGRPFYEAYLSQDAKPALPTLRVQEINAMLGLNQAEAA